MDAARNTRKALHGDTIVARRVAVVESDVDLARRATTDLESSGFVVGEVLSTQRDGLGMDFAAYDAILVARDLRDGSGIVVLEAAVELSATPVVVSMDGADMATIIDTMRAGAADVVSRDAPGLSSLPRVVGRAIEAAGRERERANRAAAARRAEHLSSLSALSSGLCHEFNNPLASIIGFAELHLKGIEDDPTACMIAILESARRLKEVVRAFTAFATGGSPPGERVDVLAAVRAGLSDCRPEIDRLAVAVSYQEPQECRPAACESSGLAQSIGQVLRNACQAMDAAPVRALRIDVEELPEHIRLTFEDTGPGVSEAMRERIFDPFFTTRDPGEGMGMGLAVCHRYLARHGGRIWCEAGRDGGAAFVLEIPVYDVALHSRRDEPHAAGIARPVPIP